MVNHKWNDTQLAPVEGSVEINLPDIGFFGSEEAARSGGYLNDNSFTFSLHGAGNVRVPKSSKGGTTYTVKTVGDDDGVVLWVRIEGDFTYFTGVMLVGEGAGVEDRPHFNGYVHAPSEGAGQGNVVIRYYDQRGSVKIVGELEHALSGAEVGGNNG